MLLLLLLRCCDTPGRCHSLLLPHLPDPQDAYGRPCPRFTLPCPALSCLSSYIMACQSLSEHAVTFVQRRDGKLVGCLVGCRVVVRGAEYLGAVKWCV
ncbi:hypothetical protein HDK77DRAFT_444061 [Phyllosticta capitalensis]|uniref:Secreted protein n=1 Tax=Phyllosticta capitalensis TaxID=121624 RepID=A0ABR1YMD6_9PEZI